MGINIQELKNNQADNIDSSLKKKTRSLSELLSTDLSLSKSLSDKKKFRFYKDLSLLLSAGIDIRMSIELSIDGEKNIKTKNILQEVFDNIIKGLTFSEGLKKTAYFSEYEYYSIKIGEESGTIITILEDLANFYEGRLEFKRKMVSAFSYPVIVLVTAMLAVVFMLSFIVPIFEDAFKRFGGELPYLTQRVLDLSESLQAYGLIILLIIAGIVVFIFSQRKKDWFRKYLTIVVLKTPILGDITSKTYLSRFCHSMSLLIRVNNPLVSSMLLVRKMMKFYPLEEALIQMEKDILKGSLLYESMSKHSIFPKRMVSLVKVAEEVNKLTIVFEQIQSQYDSETENSSKTISSLLEPFLIIFIGFFVGIILIAMYLPLFELGSGIQ
ncbi:MAG: type II secretion system F family protein [Flavobacteriales bacterium]|nr:type II secretion system F family protein [Flavobacteriales bacterium]